MSILKKNLILIICVGVIMCWPLSTLALHKFSQGFQFPIKMLNETKENVYISFRQDVGRVYLDEVLEDHTLLLPGQFSSIYGVVFAPRDPTARFKIIFEGKKTCELMVGYFQFPESPKVSQIGPECEGAGYKMMQFDYQTLILYIS